MIKELLYRALSVTAQYPIEGFDASEGVGILNWDMVARTSMNFCSFRTCYGKDVDDQWINNYLGASRIGMPWMGYFVPLFSGDWKVQTDNYLSLLDTAGGSPMPPALDVEDKYNPLNKSMTLSWLEKSHNRIYNVTGKRPVIYTRKSYWNAHVERGDVFKNCLDWLAQYNQSIPFPTEIPNDWTKNDPTWWIWQDWNKMAGEPFGTHAKLDHNWFNGNDAVFISKFGVAPYHAPIAPQVCVGDPLCMEVLQQGLKIRSTVNGTVVGTLNAGDILNVLDVGGNASWIRHSLGWSNVQDGNDVNMKKFIP